MGKTGTDTTIARLILTDKSFKKNHLTKLDRFDRITKEAL
jgi:hypothetical protein